MKYFILAILPLLMMACASKKETTPTTNENKNLKAGIVVSGEVLPTPEEAVPDIIGGGVPMPPAVLYRTKGDYSTYVPVQMNDAHTEIISYPAPSDLLRNGKPVYPTKLEGGFYLDNIGIGPNTAYLSFTIEEYTKMESAPSLETMKKHILVKFPMEEIYTTNSSRRDSDGADYYNSLINQKMVGCTRTYPAAAK